MIKSDIYWDGSLVLFKEQCCSSIECPLLAAIAEQMFCPLCLCMTQVTESPSLSMFLVRQVQQHFQGLTAQLKIKASISITEIFFVGQESLGLSCNTGFWAGWGKEKKNNNKH